MKRKGWMAVVLMVVSAMGWAGLTIADVREFATVGQQHAAAAVNDAIPLPVKMDRLEVVLGKLDQQLSQQKLELAKSQVALEDSEARLTREHDAADRNLSELNTLRNLMGTGCQTVKVGCHTVSPIEIRRAMATRLTMHDETQKSITASEEVLSRQRQAYQAQANRHADWTQQRSLLAHRLESLRARHATQVATSKSANTLDTTELVRATQLADDIEQRLRVLEKQQALGTDPVADLLNPSKTENDIESRVDRLLAEPTTAASR